MKFLLISDVHGNTEVLDKLEPQFKEADVVLFAGDFARFKAPETGLPALEKLCSKHDAVFSVIGNCDDPSFLAEIEKKDISVEGSLVNWEGLVFAGSGGGSKFSGETLFERSDEELAADLDIVARQGEQQWDNLVILIHNPPKDSKCDAIANGMHVGSPLLRAFIEKHQPLAAVTGHIHESAAIDTIGRTTAVNPGALADGHYAWLEAEKTADGWKVTRASLETV